MKVLNDCDVSFPLGISIFFVAEKGYSVTRTFFSDLKYNDAFPFIDKIYELVSLLS
ncbi:hypothetical protein ECSTECDG1313_2503 [Escherichia coli STEC_DG131-3]|nr:hypothetical protein ECSTECDG1313_2503 [Escherichia coli STEC_DG131-3]EIH23939.1 hypothetical protein EC12264_3499 [Escherichia coli 1.2264]